MKLGSIWVGHYYAFSEYKGNKYFVYNAKKGKALRTEQTKGFGRERGTSYVYFEVEREGYEPYEVRVRARDVIDFWEDYERERAHLQKERETAEETARLERERVRQEVEERIRLQREQRERELQAEADRKDKLVAALLSKTGIPETALMSVGTTTISLDRTAMELWLSVNGHHST